ncbi:MAG: hypothetical protein H0X72_03325 [Acidobacteria bacterium]|jgi:hypothetical protein|nr:hypothetical protein [Acidobacteriota bacterium]
MRENNTTKTNKTENKELTSYQKLLITLDDDAKAYDFKVKTLDRAKALIGDILSVTTGSSVVTEYNGEWGHGHFLELFEMLSIRHKNFDVPDFIADLKEYLFTWTMKHDEDKRNWEKALLAERGLDEHGIELETPIEADSLNDAPAPEAQTQPEQPKPKTLAEDTLQLIGENSDATRDGDLRLLASQISSVMKNDAMPTQLFNVMADELSDTPSDWRSPESVLFNLEEMKKAEVKNEKNS